jgi:hypothetical protein
MVGKAGHAKINVYEGIYVDDMKAVVRRRCYHHNRDPLGAQKALERQRNSSIPACAYSRTSELDALASKTASANARRMLVAHRSANRGSFHSDTGIRGEGSTGVEGGVDRGAGPVACRARRAGLDGRSGLVRGPSVYERRQAHKSKSADAIGHEWIGTGNINRGK